MSKMKNTIPENYVCENYCKEICFECHYAQETSHIYYKYRPSIESWYNKITKKRGRNGAK